LGGFRVSVNQRGGVLGRGGLRLLDGRRGGDLRGDGLLGDRSAGWAGDGRRGGVRLRLRLRLEPVVAALGLLGTDISRRGRLLGGSSSGLGWLPPCAWAAAKGGNLVTLVCGFTGGGLGWGAAVSSPSSLSSLLVDASASVSASSSVPTVFPPSFRGRPVTSMGIWPRMLLSTMPKALSTGMPGVTGRRGNSNASKEGGTVCS
jgi:hypothetical protein